MRRLIVSLTVAIGSILRGKFALALAPRQVYLYQLSGLKLFVWPGQGLTLNFLPAHLLVIFASFGHPGHFTLSSDGSLCPLSAGEGKGICPNPNMSANVLLTRLIDPPLVFPGLQASADGSTQLSLEVQTPDGEKKAVPLELVPGKGQPEYAEIDVLPDSQRPTALAIPLPQQTIQQPIVPSTSTPNDLSSRTVLVPPSAPQKVEQYHSQPQAALPSNPNINGVGTNVNQERSPSKDIAIDQVSSSISDANAAAFGLSVANRKGQIKPGTSVWDAAQRAIAWLRRGSSREEAARQAGLDTSILNQLIAWGKNRP